ncbi:MAG: tripartite tricarboxylate transporter substrate-binding protein [Beijerinckiaceae bacterium]|nr:tripartite tricarboxylate transporter substrate-binding protein [Beijerinckiaceae bacterium]
MSLRVIIAALAAVSIPTAVKADEKGLVEFYSKNNLSIAVGFSAGGNYDLYARLIARHLDRHIPGTPRIIVQNVPGAGGRIVMNRAYATGPFDGSLIVLPNQGVATDQALADPGVKYDARQFSWIGSPIVDVNVAWMWHTSNVRSLEDAKKREVVVGATGPNSPTYYVPRILNQVLGTQMRVVSGYPGSTELDRAIESGELDGRGTVGWNSLKVTSDWVATKKAHVIFQIGLTRAPDLSNVRLLQEFATSSREAQIFEFLALSPGMGRPFALPPKVPADRVKAMRAAFGATMNDPSFLNDAAKARLDISAVSGEQLQTIIDKTLAAPSEVLDVLHAAMK